MPSRHKVKAGDGKLKAKVARVLAALLFLITAAGIFAGCGRGSNESAGANSGPGEVTVVFRIGGDDFAEERQLSEARALGRKVEAAGLGRLVSWSTGMGKMELRFSVTDRGIAPGRIDAFLRSERPPWKFSVE